MTIETRLVGKEDAPDGAYPGRDGDTFVQLVASNGTFLLKDTLFYKAVVKIPTIVDLAELKESVQFKFHKMPLELFRQIELFFERVWEKHKSEAVALLYVSPERWAWKAKIPKQRTTQAHADYDCKEMPKNFEEDGMHFFLFGSVHSHGSMTAFHSGTDDADERHFDGLHVTIGNIAGPEHSYAVRFMIHGSAFGPLKLRDVIQHPAYPEVAIDDKWLEQVNPPSAIVSPQVWVPGGYNDWGKARGAGPGLTVPHTTGATSSNRKSRKKRSKLRWKPRASFDHCYCCAEYAGDGHCAVRDRTSPMASCNFFTPNQDVPDRFVEEAANWASLINPGGEAQK